MLTPIPRGDSAAKVSLTPDLAAARIRELEDEVADLRAELERSERRTEAMKQIGRVLGSSLAIEPMLNEIVARTTELLEADRSTLFLVDRASRELVSKVMQADEMREIRLPVGTGLSGWVAEHGKPVHIRDAYNDPRFNPEVDKRSGYKTRCMLVWPIRAPHSDAVIGVLQVLNKRRGTFESTDERLLEAIASEIGVALEVGRLYGELVERSAAVERAHAELALLFETERAISESQDLVTMLETILDTALTRLDARVGFVHLLDDPESKGPLMTKVARGAGERALRKVNAKLLDRLLSKVIDTGEPVMVNDGLPLMRGRLRARCLLAVPIKTRDGVIGVLELLNKRPPEIFSGSDVDALAVVASQVGRAIVAERERQERARAERLTTIGRMLSGVVHDLRTPLTLISGYTEMMATTDGGPEREQYARLVLKQVELVTSMTKDLLGFARGERSILVRKVYVQRFMEEVEEYLVREFDGTGVELTVDVRYRGAARFDENKIRRVFHNLARNAREAMPGGGKFHVSVHQQNNDLVFEMADSGPGIPPELEGKLFEPFTSVGKRGGTGLGLAMVKNIAEEHHGSVRCESSPGKGTRFVFSLPLG